MGGRKGYSIKRVVGNLNKVRREKKALIQGIKAEDANMAVSSTARILAKSDEALDAIVHGYLFIRTIDPKTHEQLAQKNMKERRLGLSDKWSSYGKKANMHFSPTINRNVVDSATRAIERKK